MRRISRQLFLILFLSGCASGPPVVYGQLMLEWQDDSMSDWMLQPEREWMGDSPYLTGRAGLKWDYGIKCPEISSSTSLFTGAPFKDKTAADPQQELHWVRYGCGIEKEWDFWGGK